MEEKKRELEHVEMKHVSGGRKSGDVIERRCPNCEILRKFYQVGYSTRYRCEVCDRIYDISEIPPL